VAALSLVLLIATAIFLNYVDRGIIGVAAPLMKAELGLSATTFGVAVSAFFWIYAPIQLLIGWLCDRISVYRLFSAGVALWALSTTLTGLVAGFTSLIILRLLLGIGESIAFPGSSKIIARHVPDSRRGIANAAVAVALALGPALGTLGGGFIMAWFGWRAIFLVFGIATLAWLVPWELRVRSLREDVSPGREQQFAIGKLAKRWSLWAAGIGHFASNYGFYFVLAWLPLYLVQSRGYSIATMTLLATTVYVAQAVSSLGLGWLSDHLVSGGQSEAKVRRIMIACAQAAQACCILGIAFAQDAKVLAIWLVLTGAAFGPVSVNLYCIAQMFAGPRAAGTWIGVQNAIGNGAGIVQPILTGIIIDRTASYSAAFFLAAAVCAAGAVWWGAIMPDIRRISLD
jgi:MFS family permease